MHAYQKPASLVVFVSLIVAVFLPLVHSSSYEAAQVESLRGAQANKSQKLNPKLSSDVVLHGFLLWSSVGFLMPIGILIIKLSNTEQCAKRLKILFYFHVIVQILSVLLATAGAVLSIKNFENDFNNNHQRIGLGLYGIIWVQALTGFFRPERGSKQRSLWFLVHWLNGILVTVLGINNIYTGLQSYHERTSKSVKLWTILFTAEICFIAFLYLLQDKWSYLKAQGVNSGDELIKSAEYLDQIIVQNNHHKDVEQTRPNQEFAVESERFTFQIEN